VIVIVENDQFEHSTSDYILSCELSRMEQISESIMKAQHQQAVAEVGEEAALTVACRPILFVRYNCDSYTIDGEKRKSRLNDREAKVMEFLESVAAGKRAYTEPLNIVYICYSSSDGQADIMSDPDYSEQMRACVRESIY
jgi:hypothetical protein